MTNFRQLLLMTCLLLGGFISAQPSISSDAVFDIGDSAQVLMGTGFFQPGPSGANVTWDFSGLGSDTSWTWVAQDPAMLPHKDSFPGANLAFRFPADDTTESLNFYRNTNDSLFYLGSASSSAGGSGVPFFQMYNRQAELIAAFPFTYGESFQWVHRGGNYVSIGGNTLFQSRYGTVTRTVDGHGTLITPFGTFNNAVRVKTQEVNYDTLFFFFPVAQQVHFTRYTWYAEGEKYLLMELDSSAIIALGLPATPSYNHMYRMSDVTGGSNGLFSPKQNATWLNVYPNPASDAVELDFEWPETGRADISLLDLQGRTHRSHQSEVLAAGNQSLPLTLEGLTPGVYVLRLQGPRSVAVRRLVVR